MREIVNERKQAAVLGAAGKMGSGIALLLLQDMAFTEGAGLTLLDLDPKAFEGLTKYLRQHLRRYAEKNINEIRKKLSARGDLVDNGEIVQAFVEEAMDKVRYVTTPDECKGADLVFEAVFEDVDIKAAMFKSIDQKAGGKPWYFTNTSSIPIHVLQEKSGIRGRIVGYHFYNPPPVQKLLEIIIPQEVDPRLKDFSLQLAGRLRKTVVFSNDVAGFIGNGHFIREIAEACVQVHELEKRHSAAEAVCIVNSVTQEFLLRPMGVFQLVDYVGIDVCTRVASIMNTYLGNEVFADPLIASMLERGIRGGQSPDGSQRDGFFHYEKGYPAAVFDLTKGEYVPYVRTTALGPLPPWHHSWKKLVGDKERKEKIGLYFSTFWEQSSAGTEVAKGFLEKSREIARGLVQTGVAQSVEDVDAVLQQGFFHLYGVDEPFSTRSVSR